MDEWTKDRVGKNEAFFREVNERVKEIGVNSYPGQQDLVEFLCECGEGECLERVSLTGSEYEELRASPVHFALVPGHEKPEVEQVIRDSERFLVVQKKPEAQPIARREDPRS